MKKLLLVLAFLLLPSSAFAAVALDSNGAGIGGGVTGVSSQTTSATIAANSVLVVYVMMTAGSATVSSVKWNTSETATSITSNSTLGFVGAYGLTTPTSGTHNIVVTFSGTLSGGQTAQIFWMSATGAGTVPFTGVNSDVRFIAVTTTVAGSLVTDAIYGGASLTASGSEILLNRDTFTLSNDIDMGYQLVASPSTVNASWSVSGGPDTGHSHVAVTIAPNAPVSAQSATQMLMASDF